MVASEWDGVAVLVELAGGAERESLLASAELVLAGGESGPALVCRSSADNESLVAHECGRGEVREASGRRELAGIGVGDVGVPASGVPCELGDLLGTNALADGAPVLDAEPHGGVSDAGVGPGAGPVRVGAGACFAAGRLEEPACVLSGVAEGEAGDGVEPGVEGARLAAVAALAAVVVAASAERGEQC